MYNPFKKKGNKVHQRFINETMQYLSESGLDVFDAQIACQTAEFATRGKDYTRILEVAIEIANRYKETREPNNLFSTDMSVLGMKMTESLNKIQLADINLEEV